ncbi:MAG: transcription elongation factor GreA [Candidatus Saccharibacteria bacterium]
MVNKKSFYVTSDGLEKLREELDDLVNVQRKKIAAALKEAKEFGDLSENASWDDAKERQAFIEGRIAEIENILKNAVAIEKGKGDIVAVGSTVHVELEEGEQQFSIVGSTEADPELGKISNESPIGKALLGKKPGDEVEVQVPAGTITYKITKIA